MKEKGYNIDKMSGKRIKSGGKINNMKNLKRKIFLAASVAVLSTVVLGGCGKLNDSEVVAEVGEDKITAGVANFYARMQQAQFETYYSGFMGDNMWETELSDGVTYESQVKDTLIENLENMYLMEDHMKDYNVELSKEEKEKITSAAKDFVENNALADKEIVSGDEENVERVLTLLTIQNKMEPAMKSGVDENVTDEEAAQKQMEYVTFSYTKTGTDGTTSAMTDDEKALVKETAQNFVNQLQAAGNTDLDAAAQEAGLEVQTATFDSDSTSPDADVVKAADSMEEGQVSDLIETDSGCYVVKLTSLLDREATDAKKPEIVEQRKTDQYDSLLKKWKKDTTVKLHKKVWEKISFIDQGVTLKQEEEEDYAVGSDQNATNN